MDASHEAALQRLRDTLESHRWRFATTFVNDLQALLDMLDAAGPLLAAADAYAEAYDEWFANLDKSDSRGIEGEHAGERAYNLDRATHLLKAAAIAQQPPAAALEDT